MNDIRIIDLGVDDVHALRDISRETFSDTFAHTTTPEDLALFLDEAYDLDKLRRELTTPGSEFRAVTVDGELAGYLKTNIGEAQSEEMPDTHFEIERLYIRRPYKRLGLGSRLMELALERARELGRTHAWLGVWEHNEPAKAFYTRHGFTFFGSHAYPVGNDPQVDLLMVRDLRDPDTEDSTPPVE